MTNSFQKITITTAGALSLTALAPQTVQAATLAWDLKFFDDAGALVGNGEFSYDPDTTAFVPTDGSDNPPGFTVQNDLESFAATILGEKWRFEAGPTWWAEPARPPGQLNVIKSGFYLSENSWFFGYDIFGFQGLNLDIESASDNAGIGKWTQRIGSVQEGSYEESSGVWTAKPVPEPTSTLGLLAIGIFSAFSVGKHKLNKQKST